MKNPVEEDTVVPDVPNRIQQSVVDPISTISLFDGRAVADDEPPTAALTRAAGDNTWIGWLSWSLGRLEVTVY